MQFSGKVVKGVQVGEVFGMATANLEVETWTEVEEGVYVVEVGIRSQETEDRRQKEKRSESGTSDSRLLTPDSQSHKGLLHIGPRKTFGGEKSIEVHLLDFEQDIYSEVLEVEVLKKVRGTKKFENADALFSQIERDILVARKYFLRRDIKKYWEDISERQKRAWRHQTVEAILQDVDFKEAKEVWLYAGEEGCEIDFAEELMHAVPDKIYLFPKVQGKQLIFSKASHVQHLEEGAYGIREPVWEEAYGHKTIPDQKTLICVPCQAMDPKGVRLGRGKGYYDRLLERIAKESEEPLHKTLSVVPGFAYVENIPQEAHDVPVDKVMVVG